MAGFFGLVAIILVIKLLIMAWPWGFVFAGVILALWLLIGLIVCPYAEEYERKEQEAKRLKEHTDSLQEQYQRTRDDIDRIMKW